MTGWLKSVGVALSSKRPVRRCKPRFGYTAPKEAMAEMATFAPWQGRHQIKKR
jgi:hypothetical protein